MFILYENAYLKGSELFSHRTGCYLLDRKELSDFVFQYNLNNKYWLTLQNNLHELDNCTNSLNVHERIVYRQAAEGFFIRISDLINRRNTLRSDWYYRENNVNLVCEEDFTHLQEDYADIFSFLNFCKEHIVRDIQKCCKINLKSIGVDRGFLCDRSESTKNGITKTIE